MYTSTEHAEVVLKEAGAVKSNELQKHVGNELGGYKTPKTLDIVAELPVSVVGKVLRRKVWEKYWTDTNRKVG
ncbi:MAG: hypothetical protein DRQ65_00720 [Gammaproteobacteria bacterium]|nr:MAG: hypothetical protein DRQ98_08955 [Gammaproteobacteria bacterium]RLA57810.1 MAG: hypothetical protein DRQ65_00720 [Gammaproteobacteria bacterium]HDY82020.1 hypothetical protein [Halieaceae bacterium]